MNEKSPPKNETRLKGSLYKHIVMGLRNQPAYLLVFAVSALFVLSGLTSTTMAVVKQNILFATIGLVSFTIALGAVVLVVRVVEKNNTFSDDGNEPKESDSDRKPTATNNVILYMPLLHLNPFFSSFLEWFCYSAQQENLNVILKTGHNITREQDCSVDHFLDGILKSDMKDYTIVIFPPHPDAYRELLNDHKIKKFRDLKVILMDIDPLDVRNNMAARMQAISKAEYIKSFIVLDNKKACEEAAKAVIECVEGKSDNVNIVLCDGDYHSRGAMFRDSLDELAKTAKGTDDSKRGIAIDYIPSREVNVCRRRIKFSSALEDSYKYISDLFQHHQAEIMQHPTFIFCANDVIALGARKAMDRSPRVHLEQVFIIAYDGSSLLRAYSTINDPYIRIFLSQNYNSYTGTLVEEIKKTIEKDSPKEHSADGKIKKIIPGISINGISISGQEGWRQIFKPKHRRRFRLIKSNKKIKSA